MATVVRTAGPLNKTQLAEAVAAELGVSQALAARAVDSVLNTVARTLASGHSVTVTNFGTWLPKHTPARNTRNPQTGETWIAPAYLRAVFRASDRLADAVRAQDPTAADITKRTSGGAR